MRAPRLRRRSERLGLRRGVYVLPTLFTVANVFCGFLSIVAATNQQFGRAATFILIAIIADILDGRIARLTGSTSSFGEVYDSLADVISFGVAPALLAYRWGLVDVPRFGIAAAFLFLVAGSIRLARFSSRAHDSRVFSGLPIPAAAGAVALLVLLSPEPVRHPALIPVAGAFVLCLSLLMVSNLPYRSFKDVDLRRRWPATTVFAIALVLVITLSPHVLSLLCALYILSAPVAVVTRRLRRRSPVAPAVSDSEETSHGPGN